MQPLPFCAGKQQRKNQAFPPFLISSRSSPSKVCLERPKQQKPTTNRKKRMFFSVLRLDVLSLQLCICRKWSLRSAFCFPFICRCWQRERLAPASAEINESFASFHNHTEARKMLLLPSGRWWGGWSWYRCCRIGVAAVSPRQ